ncbi:hypothetical protein GXW78_17585 [Roseomonas terrae]|uniref:Uncharacterized protein n=1 Tax=Neoroseomonas terrae TaxID=424799 RepID=A0ABS5EKD2_9PROT|nr:DUF6790 family protein [Neoroseomonas terrae]MBR0651486.1 hypothetical protein [Neoroseomonas terrae]
MHTAIVALLTMILPLACTLAAWASGAPMGEAIGRWFAFWAVGVRLFTAGLSQVIRPRFTSETIFAVTDPRARPLVRELGFGNIALGTLGIASIAFPSWVVPAAVGGAVFYGLAGAAHVMAKSRNAKRRLAMVTDLAVAGVLVVALVAIAVD